MSDPLATNKENVMSAKKSVRTLSAEEMRNAMGGVGPRGSLFSEREIPQMKSFVRRVPARNRALKGRV